MTERYSRTQTGTLTVLGARAERRVKGLVRPVLYPARPRGLLVPSQRLVGNDLEARVQSCVAHGGVNDVLGIDKGRVP